MPVEPDIVICILCIFYRCFGRLIRSSRAGVGKSLQKSNLVRELKRRGDVPEVTIPFYKTVNADDFFTRLVKFDSKTPAKDADVNVVHIDVAYEVR